MPLGAAKIAYQGYSVTAEAGITRPQTITAVNDTQVDTAISKFGGGSMLMDGTGDYAYITGGDGTGDFSGDFTIEFWLYLNSLSNANIFDLRGIHSTHTGGGTGTFALASTLLIAHNSGDFKCWIDGADRSTSGVIFSTGTWYHIAVQRSSGTVNAWVNGTRYVDYSGSTDDYTSVLEANQPIGANSSTSTQVSFLNGAIDEFRISTVARYTNGASITTPTAAFVNDDDTYLLMHANGTDGSTAFTDDAGVRASIGVSSLGDAEIDTAQSKFGGSSAYFNGSTSTDQRVYAYDATGTIGSGDYTVETWFRAESWLAPSAITYITSSLAFYVRYSGGVANIAYYRGSGTWGTTSLALNTWYHLAWSREGSTVRAFVNGNLEFTLTSETIVLGSDPLLGCKAANNQDMDGWLDSYRISDVARYTSAFTAPTTEFENDADTVLLLNFNGTDGSTDFVDDNG